MQQKILEERLPGRRSETVTSYRDAVLRVLGVCRQRLGEDLSLDEMARVAHMSPYHFHRTFRQITGLTPGQFLAALRMEEARRRLVETGQSVTDISLAVGYRSLGTFTHRFSALVGLTPTDFRERSRELADRPMGELAAEAVALFALLMADVEGQVPALEGAVEADPAEELRLDDCLIFLGCFDRPIPEHLPSSWALREGAGPFSLPLPADGAARLLAIALPAAASTHQVLLDPGVVRAVGLSEPLEGAPSNGSLTLRLRPLDPLDPPVLLAMPVLLEESTRALAAEATDDSPAP